MTPAKLAAQVNALKILFDDKRFVVDSIGGAHLDTLKALIADWERRGKALENIVSAWDDSMEDGNTLADLAREALERKE